jgi:hypothetical protein
MLRAINSPCALVILLVVIAWLGGCVQGGAPAPSGPPSATIDGGRITGRDFLLPGQTETTQPEPYGLYSYLLFGSEPSETTRPRYLEAIRAYLQMLQPVQALEREGATRPQLNVTYLPVLDPRAAAAVGSKDPHAPEVVLQQYSYARAQILLAKLPGGPYLDGPYFLSYREPLGRVERLSEKYGWVDMSTVPAARIDRWVRIFIKETAQQDYTKQATTARVWTSILDELDKAGEGAPQVLKAVVFWLP